jgi:hypothetical protein
MVLRTLCLSHIKILDRNALFIKIRLDLVLKHFFQEKNGARPVAQKYIKLVHFAFNHFAFFYDLAKKMSDSLL